MKIITPFALAGLLATAAVPASAQTFYGVTYIDDQLISINAATGLGTQIGALTPGASPSGLAFSGGSLYTFDTTSDRLLQINTSTGATLASLDIGVNNAFGEGGLAFNGAGQGFLSSPLDNSFNATNALYQFTPGGGPATLVGATSDSLAGLTFGAGGVLYGLGKGDGNLYTINPANAASTLVGNIGVGPDPNGGVPSLSPISALTFSGGGLFASINDQLYSLNAVTGKATLVAPGAGRTGIGFSSVSGIVGAPVPEASTVVSFGVLLALGGVFVLRRRKPQPQQ